jgi:hypothetical protein
MRRGKKRHLGAAVQRIYTALRDGKRMKMDNRVNR